MSFRKDKRLYNYVVNTLGLTKEFVMAHVTARLDELIAKHLADKLSSHYFENLVLNHVTNILERGFGNNRLYGGRESFQELVARAVRDKVIAQLNDEYEVQVKLVRKDAQIIGKL